MARSLQVAELVCIVSVRSEWRARSNRSDLSVGFERPKSFMMSLMWSTWNARCLVPALHTQYNYSMLRGGLDGSASFWGTNSAGSSGGCAVSSAGPSFTLGPCCVPLRLHWGVDGGSLCILMLRIESERVGGSFEHWAWAVWCYFGGQRMSEFCNQVSIELKGPRSCSQAGSQKSMCHLRSESADHRLPRKSYHCRRKFRSETSDNMNEQLKSRGEKSQKRQDQKKEDADARKGRKVAKHTVFAMICGSAGSKSRLAKAAGAEPAGQMRDEKLHAIVARSTFPSRNVQNTSAPDHFWKSRCWKSARRCGAKHISKSKCTKHTSFRPLLEVEMSKKCTPLWREAHFQVKMYKTPQLQTTFWSSDVEKVHAVVARSTFPSQNVQNTSAPDHFLKFRCRKSARRCGAKHISKSKVLKTYGLGPLLEVQMSKKCRKSARRCGAKHISKSKV